MTRSTSLTSRPLAATSVASNVSMWLSLKSPMTLSLSFWGMSPCKVPTFTPSAFSS